MKLSIAGGRDLHVGRLFVRTAFYKYKLYESVTEIVSGGAAGVDFHGEEFSQFENIPLRIFKADWNTYGKVAGPKRNKQMAEYADALLLIWDGESRGSKNMKETMEKLGKPVYEVIVRFK